MSLRLAAVFALAAALGTAAYAENPTPRDLWAQAAGAAMNGDAAGATSKLNDLFNVAKAYGVTKFPAYAMQAAAMSRQFDRAGRKEAADWAAKAARQLDPRSAAVAFSMADRARDHGDWGGAFAQAAGGFGHVFANYRTRVLSRSDLLVVLSIALALTAAVFALALFIRYGKSMAHDFREVLGTKFHGGVVSVLAFALLFLPLFLWLGPFWLVMYWLVIFFTYANLIERIITGLLLLAVAAIPVLLDRAAAESAGVDNPIIQATVLCQEQSYRPEALRRVEELVSIVSDNDVVQILFGNLQLQEGNEQQAEVHYRRAAEVKASAGAHVNLGNLHFLNNDFTAAANEYQKAEQLDPKLAIAFYNDSLASGEMYRFDEQGQKLEQAKRLDRTAIERVTENPPPQKVVMFTPTLEEAWSVSSGLARKGAAPTIFATHAYFDPMESILNPVSLGAPIALVVAIALWLWRRRTGFANACIKCGRTFCPRCKSARESATYCTQCIHIYLKKDGVALETKRRKLDEVSGHQRGMLKRNRMIATVLPGSAQVIEGRTLAGAIGAFAFLLFLCTLILVGRLAPALGPVAETAKLLVRLASLLLAVITWLLLTLPVYRRRQVAI